MVLTVEYRIPLPMSVDEYRVAQMYMIDKKSREESHGTGEERSGVEIVANEPYADGPGGSGQYTKKIFHVGTHLPGWFRAILPKSALIVVEEAWNAYPYTRTKFTTPFVDKFYIDVETYYCNDNGSQDNIFKLSPAELAERTVDVIDIANDPVERKDYKSTEDPKIFVSKKTKRGPLGPDWIKTTKPIMTAYKLARADFRYCLDAAVVDGLEWCILMPLRTGGMQSKIERFIHGTALRKTLLSGHRSAWCWQDEYHGLTMADIRRMEKETMAHLRKLMGSDSTEAAPTTIATASSSSSSSFSAQESHRLSQGADSLKAMAQAQATVGASTPRALTTISAPNSDSDSEDDDANGAGSQNDQFFDAEDDELPFEDALSDFGETQPPQLQAGAGGLLPTQPRRSATICSTTSSVHGAEFANDAQIAQAHLFLVVTGSTNFALGCQGLEDDTFHAFCDVMKKVTLDGRVHFFEHLKLPDISTALALRAQSVGASPQAAVGLLLASETFHDLGRHTRTALDALVASFKQKYAAFSGKIHIVSDCLGGLLVFDALSRVPFSFEVSNLFTLGSPVALLALERAFHFSAGSLASAVPLHCGHFFNIFGDSDAFGVRVEPLLLSEFQSIDPILLPDFRQFPQGNAEAYLARDAAVAPRIDKSNWWGDRRVDYCVDVPAGIRAAGDPTMIVQASYWELLDVAAFILREAVGRRVESVVTTTPLQPFTRLDRNEPWLSTRAARKARTLPAAHYGCDTLVLAGDHKTLTIEAHMVYGRSFYPVGERVSVYMASPPTGEWTLVARGVAVDKHGKIEAHVASQQLAPGVHPVRVVMQADHSYALCFVHVLPRPRSLVVVFNINAVFASNHSFAASSAQLRPHAVEVARFGGGCVAFWSELGYVLVYLTGRPLWQRPDVEAWMSRCGFPHGVFFFADTLMLPQAQQAHKGAVLAHLNARLQANIAAAYGSDRDIENFCAIGVPKTRIFFMGRKNEHATPVTDLAAHLSTLRAELSHHEDPASNVRSTTTVASVSASPTPIFHDAFDARPMSDV